MKRKLKLTITKIRRQTFIREILLDKAIYPVCKENEADQKQLIKESADEKQTHKKADI